MTTIQAIFFDLDNTLLDGSRFHEAIHRTCNQIATVQPGLSAERLLEANSEIWQSYWPQVEPQWTIGTLDGKAVSREAWRQTLQACGCDDDSLRQLALAYHLQFGRETYQLFDDVPALFAELKESDIRLALITNGAADTQRDKLEALGITAWFDALIISGEIGIAKPDPAIFELALKQVDVEPTQAWHIGDTLATDIAGAKAAGVAAVWINRSNRTRREYDPKPDIEIDSLSRIPSLLAA